MVRKMLPVLAALLAVLLLVNFLDPDPELLFRIVYLAVIIVGLVMSVFYLSTWGYYALRAWRNGLLRFGTFTVLEFVIIPILAVPTFATALFNVWTMGFAVVPNPQIRVSRLMGLIVLLLVMSLRTANWVSRWRDKGGTHITPQEAISDSNPV